MQAFSVVYVMFYDLLKDSVIIFGGEHEEVHVHDILKKCEIKKFRAHANRLVPSLPRTFNVLTLLKAQCNSVNPDRLGPRLVRTGGMSKSHIHAQITLAIGDVGYKCKQKENEILSVTFFGGLSTHA